MRRHPCVDTRVARSRGMRSRIRGSQKSSYAGDCPDRLRAGRCFHRDQAACSMEADIGADAVEKISVTRNVGLIAWMMTTRRCQ